MTPRQTDGAGAVSGPEAAIIAGVASGETAYPAQTCADVAAPTFTSFLNLARWSAAAMVFVGHLRNPMFLGYGDVATAERTVPVKLWYFVTGWHAEAVVVFFVLSGYLVGGLAVGKVQTGTWSFRDYSIDRVTRIYMAFLPALLLTAVLDVAGSTWFGAAGLYDNTQPMIQQKIATGAVTNYLNAETFGMNVLLLQHFLSPTFGSNYPLWTISAEFWFYFAFGFAVLAGRRKRGCRPRWRSPDRSRSSSSSAPNSSALWACG
ncbi:acyltransferase family protein [Hansschlegelia plantiphila]|uniref:Acyltransferase 3 domain-containing protein n=1 Tax=Hansschlegelia plantiphila TaxID=374655 RepID=A0A9W6MXA5_9HYPH|nr:acyltransferase family protein [Hansschlegelia plantiphila]GLK69700.1 hypothetical protein GCM10008179_33380 [Hansschlegelia plantiphila]